jgi:Fic family protein
MSISQRTQNILNFLIGEETMSADKLSKSTGLNLRTIQRELSELVKAKLVEKIGSGNNVDYKIGLIGKIELHPNPKLLDDRRLESGKITVFDFDILGVLKHHQNLFNTEDMGILNDEIQNFKSKTSDHGLSFKKEIERLVIEFSWKSSQIEGNTYSLLETEELLRNKVVLESHSQYETQMILNHKNAFDFIINNPQYFKYLTPAKIQELHYLLTNNLGIEKGYRSHGVGITGSSFKPLDNVYQISEAMTLMCDTLNSQTPIVRGLLAGLLVSYIQPFGDGNKRTARTLSNAILHNYDLPLLSFRSVKVEDYRNAIISFYEYNSIYLYKRLFISQIQYFGKAYF